MTLITKANLTCPVCGCIQTVDIPADVPHNT